MIPGNGEDEGEEERVEERESESVEERDTRSESGLEGGRQKTGEGVERGREAGMGRGDEPWGLRGEMVWTCIIGVEVNTFLGGDFMVSGGNERTNSKAQANITANKTVGGKRGVGKGLRIPISPISRASPFALLFPNGS